MNKFLIPTVAILASAAFAHGATFNTDFNSGLPAGITLQGDPDVTKVIATGGVDNSGYLQITDSQGSRSGAVIIGDFNNGQPIGGFTATLKVLIGGAGSSARPADGMSFSWGDDVPDAASGEEGAGSGLTISFDTWDNGGTDTAPAIDVKFGGTADTNIIATAFMDGQREGNRPRPNYGAVTKDAAGQPMSLQSDQFVNLKIDMHPNGTLDLVYKDTVVFTNLAIPNYKPQLARFGISARTGGATENHWLDNLNITTSAPVADTVKPTIVSTSAGGDLTSVRVKFSKSLSQASAEAVANYTLNNGLTVSKATQVNPWTVELTTSKQTPGTAYTLTVSNVQDIAATPNTIAANSTAAVNSVAPAPGFLTVNYYNGITGTAVTDLTDNPAFPNGYDDTRYIGEFATLSSYGDNYGARVTGYIVPDVTGDYNFFLRSDDSSRLYLSSNDTLPDLATATPIAEETGCCQAYLEPDASVTGWHDNGAGVGQTTLTPIHLVAGTKYAVLGLLKEGTGGDYLQVAWRLKAATNAASTLQPIPSKNLFTYAPAGGTVTITQQPVAASAVAGTTATFSVKATGTPEGAVVYQWLKNGAPIPGATTTSYTTAVLTQVDNAAKYSVQVSVPGKSLTSSEVALTVTSDVTPPDFKVGAVKNGAAYDVGVEFSEPTDASAGTQANYTVSGGTVTAFKYYPKSPGVVLTVTGLTEGSKYSVTVKNVADVSGNKITSVSKDFTAGKMTWGVVGGDELAKGNAVVGVGDNGFDIYSDSIGEWGSYDEATFVYEQVTGDFDKKLRVEFQDASSQWARAGLIARDVTNFGVDRATQEGGAAGRYQKVHVNPVGPTLTGPGNAGNGAWEGNRRLATGAATTSAGGGGVPLYPNAWCRLQRQGDLFTIYRSDDGVTWTSLGTTTFDEPMPKTLFVGPEYAPENGNITNEADRGMWVAKMRDYGDTKPVSSGATLTFQRTASGITLTYTGSLESAAKIDGPWTAETGASPLSVSTATGTKFYRAK